MTDRQVVARWVKALSKIDTHPNLFLIRCTVDNKDAWVTYCNKTVDEIVIKSFWKLKRSLSLPLTVEYFWFPLWFYIFGLVWSAVMDKQDYFRPFLQSMDSEHFLEYKTDTLDYGDFTELLCSNSLNKMSRLISAVTSPADWCFWQHLIPYTV